MKLKHVNPKNVMHLIPTWMINPWLVAKHVDGLLDQYGPEKIRPWDRPLNFWIEFEFKNGACTARIAEPDSSLKNSGHEGMYMGRLIVDSETHQVSVPINDFLNGSPSLDGKHCVYTHSILGLEKQAMYVGITKNKWYERYAQHMSSMRNGSNLLFHKALRSNQEKKLSHWVLLSGLDYESAMNLEEEFIGAKTLYPNGLNMIPGGFAGMRYLSSIGVQAKSIQDRDAHIESLSGKSDIAGRPNPLCAARWASDQNYINNVICSNEKRLTADQVRMIRILNSSGSSMEKIATHIGDKVERVKRVVRGNVYGRVA